MPYHWTKAEREDRLTLWPHNSLTPRGFATFILITSLMLLLPLLAVLGSPILWGLLPFFVITVALTWYFLRRSNKDRTIRETLVMTASEVTLTRNNPKGPDQTWSANPYWVRLSLDDKNGPVEQYLTLSGDGREVELGAFLSVEERVALHDDLATRLHLLNINDPDAQH